MCTTSCFVVLKGILAYILFALLGRETSAITANVNQNPGSSLGYHNNPQAFRSYYQKRKRITLSFYNLMHRQDSITKIANFVGFKSAYSYIKFFKDVTGNTPQEFREKYANNLKTAENILNRVSEIKTTKGNNRRQLYGCIDDEEEKKYGSS